MPSGSTSRKPQIAVTLKRKADGSFETGDEFVNRIGDRKGRAIRWNVFNATTGPVIVEIGNFDPPSPCPVEQGDFTQCKAAKRVEPGATEAFKAKINKDADAVDYTYEICVKDANTGKGNVIDPELQIDGGVKVDSLSQPIVVVVVVVALVVLVLWWALS